MEGPKVEIFVVKYDEKEKVEKTYLIQCPKTISYFNFTILLNNQKLTKELRSYHTVFKEKEYNINNQLDIMNFETGDKVVIINDRKPEFFAKFHENPNKNEKDMTTGKLTGIMKLILIRYISNFINDIKLIHKQEIREIISELRKGMKFEEDPEKDIQSNLKETTGCDILSYAKYGSSVISDEDIDYLINLVGKNMKNQIIKYWSILTKYEEFNRDFEEELFKAIENSYFDYSLIGLSIYQQSTREQYLDSMGKCENTVKKYLYHGTQIGPISKIITTGFLYTRKPFYGMGIYFSDMLDYVSFYCGGDNFYNRRDNFGKILPVNSTFSCVGTEVYYNSRFLKNIYDFSLSVKELDHFPTYEEIEQNYKNKMVKKNGVHFARVEPNEGQVRNQQDIINDKREGKFIGTEYVITEKDQMLPLYGLTFKRNEYFVLWRDPNFEGTNEFSDYLKERKLFIYKYAKMNAYFESSTERALEIIKKKKLNKIILISSIGLDLSGKKFVEIAREILGFDVMVLFFSNNQSHFSWLQNFPNALYTNDASFYKDYILNYNEKGLLDLKKKIEYYYGINLKFTDNFLKFPKFINEKEYNDIIFEEPSPNFKKVIIINSENNNIFCMKENRNPCFNTSFNFNINSYEWYVTIIGNEITFFSNGSYLGANLQQRRATGEQFMQRYYFEKINNNEYMFYYENKNNILTLNGNYAILQKESINRLYQKFKLIEKSITS